MTYLVTFGTHDRPERIGRRFDNEANAEETAFSSLGAEVGYTATDGEWEIEIARVYREVENGENELLNEFEY